MLVLLLLFFRKVLPSACHLERSPPEILPSLCSVLLRSSTPLRFAQNDTGGRSRNPKGERQRHSDLAGRLKPALWKTPLEVLFWRRRRDFRTRQASFALLPLPHRTSQNVILLVLCDGCHSVASLYPPPAAFGDVPLSPLRSSRFESLSATKKHLF